MWAYRRKIVTYLKWLCLIVIVQDTQDFRSSRYEQYILVLKWHRLSAREHERWKNVGLKKLLRILEFCRAIFTTGLHQNGCYKLLGYSEHNECSMKNVPDTSVKRYFRASKNASRKFNNCLKFVNAMYHKFFQKVSGVICHHTNRW